MDSFWDRSWAGADRERLKQYISAFDDGPDAILPILLESGAHTVCDAGCGCGIYARKLAAHGFAVSGFDVSTYAVQTARELLADAPFSVDLKTASVLDTGYANGQFDAVVSRDVLDHMPRAEAVAAARELYRITRPGGVVLFTVDGLDREYETEPHTVSEDGDFRFNAGKWAGMVFHPYQAWELAELAPPGAVWEVMVAGDGFTIKLEKP